MIHLKPACLIANVLMVWPHKEVPLCTIGKIVNKLEDIDISVNWYRPYVMEAFCLYGDIFHLEDGKVSKGKKFDEFGPDFMREEFNYTLMPLVLDAIRVIILQHSI